MAAMTSRTTATSTRASARSTTSTRCSAALHAAGIRVVIDIVPNHTSDLHEWFKEALAAGPGSAARERYIFREGSGPDGAAPPTDWVSAFGGSAWERVADGQWYLHNFAIEQPDLNWAQRRGARGFRPHAEILVRPRRRRIPHRCGAHADQGPHRAAAVPGRPGHPAPRRPASHSRQRRRARGLRRVARGVQLLQPAADGRRGSVGRPLPHPAVCEPREPGPGVQLRPSGGGLRRRPVPAHRAGQPGAGRGIRIVDHMGAVQSRRRPTCHAVRPPAPRTR